MELYSQAGMLRKEGRMSVVFVDVLPLEHSDVFMCLGEDEQVYYMDYELEVVGKESVNATCLQVDWNRQSVRLADTENTIYYFEL